MPKEFDIKKYAKLFVTESREYLRTLNESMIELEAKPDRRDLVDGMFRSCHTVKGMANMMGYAPVAELAHALEDVLGAVRDGNVSPTGPVAEVMFKGFDALEGMVAAVERGEQIGETPELVRELRAATELAASAPKPKEKSAEALRSEPKGDAVTITIRLAKKCALPAARALTIIRELEKSSTILSSDPTEEEIDNERLFEEMIVSLEPGEKLSISLDRVAAMTDVDELTFIRKGQAPESWKGHRRADSTPAATEAPAVQTVRVGMDKLDDLLDDVGELVIGRSRLIEKASSHEDLELQEISSLIDKLTSEIQSKVLSIRMIPLEVVMSRFPRMVRDISKSQGKEMELLVEGGNIELDRTVVDRITDPMMHILRNCIDHGIETAQEREKVGKRAKGMIRIVASKQQDHVLIEISDDGRGIDFEHVRKAAIRKGVMNQQQAQAALGRELIDLLFKPGFSTNTEVTEISGRGVGLDVVKRGVEELGGSVMVNTTKGAGTTISLWLPFTLAIIDAMLVSVAGQMYAVPMGVVVESQSYPTSEIRHIRTREVVQLRGEVIPLIRIRDFFGIPSEGKDTPVNVLIVQSRERRAALGIDEHLGHQQIVVKTLDRRLRKARGISGGTILGSGGIALILDTDSILGD